MISEQKWDTLRKWICEMDVVPPWCDGGGWDSAMVEVIVKMEELDDDETYTGIDNFMRICKKHKLFEEKS